MLSPSELIQIRTAATKRTEAVATLAQRICEVPAPTGHEQERAQFVAQLWSERGYTPEIDAVGNVYVRRGQREQAPILMLLAHIDTVFSQITPITVTRQGDILRGLGRIIATIADVVVPQEPKTTFNIGIIEGGTSINTIASHATALLDLRSTDTTALNRIASEAITWLGIEPTYGASSTDANIPISLNIPSVCVGVTHGARVHTLEEYLHIPPIGDGLAQLTRLTIEACTMLARA